MNVILSRILKSFLAGLGPTLLVLGAGLLQAQPRSHPSVSVYRDGLDLRDYWVSEKLDGVRGYWDGESLYFRGGGVILAPDWFLEALPEVALDGELWLGRQRFDEVSGLLRRQQPDDGAWRELKFMVFDLPHATLDFEHRLVEIRRLLARADAPWLQMIPQYRVQSESGLREALDQVVATGGEGLILHKGGALYQDRGADVLMKLKPVYEGEAVVLAHLPGQGRLAGRVGSLLVETPEGRRFRLGSGLSDAERESPPSPGSRVVYQYSGLTKTGLPRFARFIDVR